MKNILLLTCTLLFIISCNVETGSSEGSSAAVNEVNESSEPSGSHTSAEWQIWAYSTAAPSYIAKDATVLNEKMEMLREGTNGWTCLPVNPRGMSDPENGWKDAHEAMPLCGDAEVFKWISAYLSDEVPDMDYDGYAWMLHGDMGEDNSTPKVMSKDDAKEGHWIESGPHLMRMPKDPSSLDGMTTDFNSGAPYVMFSGTPYAHVMYPIQDYYKHQAQK
ncbi:uncharacterized protein METZ01_LOCUS75626 [marine metagenome]|uniref:Uncharacterized protein n=1 Tax=marine metagenome TaxID=408172 RepID=A0A381U3F2_9ZZZZ